MCIRDRTRRANEYRLLATYAGALQESGSLKVDANLSFLDGFVQQSLRSGAKPYDQSKLSLTLTGLLLASQTPTPQVELNFQPYQKQTTHADVDKDKATGIRHQGKIAWTALGYVEPEKPTKPTFPTIESKPQQGIGSQDFKGSGPISSTQKYPSMSSGPIGQQIKDYPQPQTAPIKKIEPVDPSLKEKEVLASTLFKGFDMGLGTSKLTANIPKSTTTQNVFTKPGTSAPMQQTKPQSSSNTIDLLDLDFDMPSTSTNSQPQQNISTSQPAQVGGNLFAGLGGTGQKSQPAQNVFGLGTGASVSTGGANAFEKYNITMEQFEQFWTSINDETIENFLNTKVTTENAFREFTNKVNFNVIEVIGNEVICSSRYKPTNEFVLLYGSYESSGKLEVRLKSKNKNIINEVIKNVKNYTTSNTSTNGSGLLNLF
eukprot:TRINITY_DN212_c0_g1_i13.p1 TRINITY_DN212_c0_g1~~TRINITY_DN212_c0_g1_i13.p1  ORF type:complete len:430 (+),score=90.30 TRINITY_DN212_c0_g1_i13:82-1371(+)